MEINWNIVLPITTAMAGLIVGHLLSIKRDLSNKKREVRINYLIEAYRKLERGAQPQSKNYSSADFESAIADIQMLGNVDQVKLTYEFAVQASKGDGSKLQLLLENLRKELRQELAIKKGDLPKVRPFRMT